MLPSWLNPFFEGKIAAVSIEPLSLNSFILLLIPLIFLRRRGKSAGYLLCFYLFSLYAWSVLAYTIFEFPVSYSHIIRMRSWSRDIRLIPALLSGGELNPWSEQVYGNFLLGIPFGFGLPFLMTRSTHKQMVLLGVIFAAGIEIVQLVLGLLIYQAPYRVIDIDDVWLVFTGTLVGYGALWVVASLYERLRWEGGPDFPLWNHFHAVLLRVVSGRASPISPIAQDGHKGSQNDVSTGGPITESANPLPDRAEHGE